MNLQFFKTVQYMIWREHESHTMFECCAELLQIQLWNRNVKIGENREYNCIKVAVNKSYVMLTFSKHS